MKNQKQYLGEQISFEVKLLFISVDSANDQLLDIKRDLKEKLDQVLVHYDLSDEVSDTGVDCVGIRLELFKNIPVSTPKERREAWSNAAEILKKYIDAAPKETFKDIFEAIDNFVYFENRKKEN